MEVVRITELQPKTTVEDGDYIAIDNINNGTNKVQVVNLLDATLSQENKMAPANVVGDEIATIRAAVGSPLKASTVAQMTDTNKIYVYVGSEYGYINGNWYYWNGNAWVSGGVYNSVAVVTDPTLALSGVPADAKVTGDKLSNLQSDINDDFKYIVGRNNLLDNIGYTSGYYIAANGTITANADSSYSDLIPVEETSYIFAWDRLSASAILRVHGYDENGDWVKQIFYAQYSSGTRHTQIFDCTGIKNIRFSTILRDNKPVEITNYPPLSTVADYYVGYNLLVPTIKTHTFMGVTFTVNDDGTISVSGTATGAIGKNVTIGSFVPNKSGTYYVYGGFTGAQYYEQIVLGKSDGTTLVRVFDKNHVSISLTAGETYYLWFSIFSGRTVDFVAYPMISEQKLPFIAPNYTKHIMTNVENLIGENLGKTKYEIMGSYGSELFYSGSYNSETIWAEGICSDGTYLYVSVYRPNNPENTLIRKIKISDGTVVTESVANNYVHANGLAYDSANDRIFCVAWDSETDYSTVFIIDPDTLAPISNFSIASSVGALLGSDYDGAVSCAYDNDNHKLLILTRGTKKGFAVFDSSLNFESYIRIVPPTGYTGIQGIFVENDIIYTCWNISGTDVVTMYDYEGHYIDTKTVSLDNELEGICIVNNDWYLLFNNVNDNDINLIKIYKLTSANPKTISIAEVQSRYSIGKIPVFG